MQRNIIFLKRWGVETHKLLAILDGLLELLAVDGLTLGLQERVDTLVLLVEKRQILTTVRKRGHLRASTKNESIEWEDGRSDALKKAITRNNTMKVFLEIDFIQATGVYFMSQTKKKSK
jgi:hypothetical protein